jgi:hypothetical protein
LTGLAALRAGLKFAMERKWSGSAMSLKVNLSMVQFPQ